MKGWVTGAMDPLPSSPRELTPQHQRDRLLLSAQELSSPATTLIQRFASKAVAVDREIVSPSPSCPWPLPPQQSNDPSRTPQECPLAADTIEEEVVASTSNPTRPHEDPTTQSVNIHDDSLSPKSVPPTLLDKAIVSRQGRSVRRRPAKSIEKYGSPFSVSFGGPLGLLQLRRLGSFGAGPAPHFPVKFYETLGGSRLPIRRTG